MGFNSWSCPLSHLNGSVTLGRSRTLSGDSYDARWDCWKGLQLMWMIWKPGGGMQGVGGAHRDSPFLWRFPGSFPTLEVCVQVARECPQNCSQAVSLPKRPHNGRPYRNWCPPRRNILLKACSAPFGGASFYLKGAMPSRSGVRHILVWIATWLLTSFVIYSMWFNLSESQFISSVKWSNDNISIIL